MKINGIALVETYNGLQQIEHQSHVSISFGTRIKCYLSYKTNVMYLAQKYLSQLTIN